MSRPAPTAATVIIFNGGDPLLPAVADELEVGAFTIAADSGIEHAEALGWPIDLAVGDFDSVTPAALAAAEAAGAIVERHPTAKDHTDLELALDAAAARRPDQIVVVGGHGGRVDHFLAASLVLTRDAYAASLVRALVGSSRVHVVRDRVELRGRPGDLLTLLAVAGPATGVTTAGLRYPLADEPLEPGSTRGVSNELVAAEATVALTGGVLLAVHTPSP